MTLYDELVARGLIAQVTDEEEIKELINNGKATFYIGFDPTADSLHVGHFMALCLMKRLQMAGNRPIALIGGGTAMIGDPSGRTDMRQMMTPETIQHNVDCFKKQMSRFIDFSGGKALMVNNADWLMNLNYIELLRDVGAHFSVNRMLTAECYKQRMERGLSFLEFNYMIMQSYDFYELFQRYGCNLQFGGDDQWSNMLGGTELIRRKLGKNASAKWEGSQLNQAKEILAFELTKLVHGEEEATKAQESARALFSAGSAADMPTTTLTEADLRDGSVDILGILVAAGLCPTRSEARRNVQQGGVTVNGEKVTDFKAAYTPEDIMKEDFVVRRGKKKYSKIVFE